MKYLAVLGRQPEISIAELEAVFPDIRFDPGIIDAPYRSFSFSQPSSGEIFTESELNRLDLVLGNDFSIDRLGGTLKLAIKIDDGPLQFLRKIPEGKITFGISDYSKGANTRSVQNEALRLKKILVRHGRSVRVVANKEAVLSTATSLHNGLSGKNVHKAELIKTDNEWYRVIGVQDIEAYARRDQARPARDARVGMLPPKLAQILINLCGSLEPGSTILDPFCGTGVVLQEALLMGYRAYGTDVSEKMVKYSEKNLQWLVKSKTVHSRAASLAPVDPLGRPLGVASTRNASISSTRLLQRSATGLARYSSPCQAPYSLELNSFQISQGDATSYQWQQPIDAVVCEGYLGKPFAKIPTEMELKEQKQECGAIVIGFLKNLAGQIKADTPVVIAVPAWLRESGEYSRLDIIDEIAKLGYNVDKKTREGLLYHREKQVVARDILILRKK